MSVSVRVPKGRAQSLNCKAMSRAPLRILIVQGELPHYRVPLFDQLARYPGFSVTIVHSGSPARRADSAFEEVIVDCIRAPGFRIQRHIGSIARQHDVTIAMFDVRWLVSVGLGYSRELSRGLVYWGHGFGRSRAVRPLRMALARRARAMVFYSESGRREFVGAGIDAEKLFVVPNTIHVPNFGFDAGHPRRRFLFVGRLQERKRVDRLLRAFHDIRAEVPADTGLSIVGDGPVRRSLEALACELDLVDRVRFYGSVTDPTRLKEIFQESLAYVSPGPVGLGLLHAFAYGVPVVVPRHLRHGPEIENLKDGVSGWYYDGSSLDLSRILRDLAADPSRSIEAGSAAYSHYVRSRTMEQMVEAFAHVIKHVAGAPA